LLLASVAASAAELGDDEVALKNGGMLRGTVVAVEPGKQVVILVGGEKRVLPWKDVERVERGKHARTPEPEPAVATAPPPEPPRTAPKPEERPLGGLLGALLDDPLARPPPRPAPGVVRLHVFSEEPKVELWRSGAPQIVHTGAQIVVTPSFERLCRAPCDVIVDGRKGDAFFFAGEDVPPSDPFTLTEAQGDVAAVVDVGSPAARTAGTWLGILGLVGVVTGPLIAMAGYLAVDPAESDNDIIVAGGITLGAGAALLVGGILLNAASSTEVELVAPASERGVSLSTGGATWRF
jgi:hypothetical protein